MAFTLDSLIQDLEQQALVKSAADENVKKEEKKDEKKPEDDKSKTEGKEPESKKDESETESGKEEQEKKASADLAQQIMQKVASAQSTEETNEMQKQASIAGKALADALLIKLASAGDVSTTNGVPAGVVPNKSQVDNAQLVAEQDGTIKPMPTGDGIKNEGSINQIFDAIVQDAISQGGVNKTEVEAGQIAGKEGAVESHATPNQVPNESVEKSAAVSHLVAQGVDFDSAVDMVKSAAAELAAEEIGREKQAAVNSLIEAGVDFDSAIQLVQSKAQELYGA